MKKTAFVTGRGGGIGSAVDSALTAAGYVVTGPFHRNDTNLTDVLQVQKYADEIISAYGCPYLIVNNAGIAQTKQFQDISEDDWSLMLDSDLKSAYCVIKAFLPSMISQKRGCIINISSMWGQVGASCEAHYAAAKGGLAAMTKSLAKELGPSGIRVNAVSPGCINTGMLNAYSAADKAALIEATPLGRLGTPQDVANAVLFLADEKASFITGQDLGVNGGFVI